MASRLTGNWKGVIKLTNNLDKDLMANSKDYLKDESKQIQDAIKNVINNQTQNWTPLKSDTVKKKGSSKMLIETGQLVDSITVIPQSDLEYIIAPEGNHSSGLSNSQLAIYHEYGTEKVPPRPFIRPVFEENAPQVVSEMKEIVRETINKYK